MKHRRCIPEEDTVKCPIINDRYVQLAIAADFGASFIISGFLAASFKTVIAPLERIKLILQTQASSHQMARAEKTSYSGFLDALIRIPQEQGFLSLWRGNFINICRYFPTQAINFSFYDLYHHTFVQVIQPKTIYSRNVLSFLAGGAVGITSCTLLYPLTFCTTRISVDVGDSKRIKREFYSLHDCLYKVFRSDGCRGFYQGLSSSVIGMFLYRSTYFGVYTTGKQTYLNDYTIDPTNRTLNAPFLVSLALAQLASTFSTMISYPLDTISRQQMLWSGRGPESYMTMRQVVIKIMQKEGPIGLYRGVFTNLMTTVCGSFILVSYDLIKDIYLKYKEPRENRDGPDK